MLMIMMMTTTMTRTTKKMANIKTMTKKTTKTNAMTLFWNFCNLDIFHIPEEAVCSPVIFFVC